MSVPVLRQSTIDELRQVIDGPMFASLVTDHEVDVRACCEQILVAVSANKADLVRAAAHRIKSASLSLGAEELQLEARFVEERAHDGELSAVTAAVPRILNALSRYVRTMRQLGY